MHATANLSETESVSRVDASAAPVDVASRAATVATVRSVGLISTLGANGRAADRSADRPADDTVATRLQRHGSNAEGAPPAEKAELDPFEGKPNSRANIHRLLDTAPALYREQLARESALAAGASDAEYVKLLSDQRAVRVERLQHTYRVHAGVRTIEELIASQVAHDARLHGMDAPSATPTNSAVRGATRVDSSNLPIQGFTRPSRQKPMSADMRQEARAPEVAVDVAVLMAAGVDVGAPLYDRGTVLSFIGDPKQFAYLSRRFEPIVRSAARSLPEADRNWFQAAGDSLKQGALTVQADREGTPREAGERTVAYLEAIRSSGWTMPEITWKLKKSAPILYDEVRRGSASADSTVQFARELARGQHPLQEGACDRAYVPRAWLDWRREKLAQQA